MLMRRSVVASAVLVLAAALAACGGAAEQGDDSSLGPTASGGGSAAAGVSPQPSVPAPVRPAADVKQVATWTSKDPDGDVVRFALMMAAPILLSESSAAGALACRDNVNHPNESVAVHVQIAATAVSQQDVPLQMDVPGGMVADSQGVCDRSGLRSSVALPAGGATLVDYWVVEPDVIGPKASTITAATKAFATDLLKFHRPVAQIGNHGYSDQQEGSEVRMQGTHVVRCRHDEWVFLYVPRSYRDREGGCTVGIDGKG